MRTEELASDVLRLKRYFKSDDVLGIDYDDELDTLNVSLTERGFMKKFNSYKVSRKETWTVAERMVDGVMFTAILRRQRDD